MDLRIDHLFDHPGHVPLVAGWIHREFWQDKAGYSPRTFEDLLRDANDPDRIPLSLLALADGEPAGTVNLIESDSPSRPHLHPWLAALVVVPPHRGKGIGRALCVELLRHARRLGVRELFVGAEIPAFYEALGARKHEQLTAAHYVLRFPL